MLNQTSSVEVKIEVYNLSLKKIIFITEFNEIQAEDESQKNIQIINS